MGTDGRLGDITASTGATAFISAAVDAAKQWLFEPSRVNGVPAQSSIELYFRFYPPRDPSPSVGKTCAQVLGNVRLDNTPFESGTCKGNSITARYEGPEILPADLFDVGDDPDALLAYLQRLARIPAAPGAFDVALSGVQGRVVSLMNSKGDIFTYRCVRCAFLASESGVVESTQRGASGILLEVSIAGDSIAATCREARCFINTTDSPKLEVGWRPMKTQETIKLNSSSEERQFELEGETTSSRKVYFRLVR